MLSVGAMSGTSIYDSFPVDAALRGPEARGRTRRLRHQRVEAVDPAWRHRETWLDELRRQYAAAPDPRRCLGAAMVRLDREVSAMEARVAALPRDARRDPAVIRGALELLRRYARSLAADWSWLDVDDRDVWRALLEVEHRGCYAAAGTTRADFERAVGRAGAR